MSMDFHLSSTRDPTKQSTSTVRVRLRAWNHPSNPDVVYGVYVGYGGGGTQEIGYFKLIQSTAAFFSRHTVEEGTWGTGEEVSPSWEVCPDGGDNTWTETDEEQLAEEWDYLLLFDPPMSVDDSEADDDFDNDVDGATAFFPSVLAAMQPGYGDGSYYLLEGEKNDGLLAQLSRHWPLLTSFS